MGDPFVFVMFESFFVVCFCAFMILYVFNIVKVGIRQDVLVC
ncbi:hypothetical protein COLSTE_00293 [Collinsella stercoris DSM 13279]|uniref:Uncharacterized protein n=1 Tax=Collinsella stercoris DSM 13279 TaxID=445975 RepID=B6G8A2_9ACTN|nr:hypothetical protein COLSTE_00293 [Collinsella stercoris DSM 13279]